MKNLKNLPTPIKVFVTITITILLTFLTFLIMTPFQLLYEFSDNYWDTVTVITGIIYFSSTVYYMFNTKSR